MGDTYKARIRKTPPGDELIEFDGRLYKYPWRGSLQRNGFYVGYVAADTWIGVVNGLNDMYLRQPDQILTNYLGDRYGY